MKNNDKKKIRVPKKRIENTKKYFLLVPVEVREYNGDITGWISPNELKEAKLLGQFKSKEEAISKVTRNS